MRPRVIRRAARAILATEQAGPISAWGPFLFTTVSLALSQFPPLPQACPA